MSNSDTEQDYGLPPSASVPINTVNSTKYYFVSKGGFEGLSKAGGIATSVTIGMVAKALWRTDAEALILSPDNGLHTVKFSALQRSHGEYACFRGCIVPHRGISQRQGRATRRICARTLIGVSTMTLHDVALTAKDTADSAMKVTEWLEYYAPATPAAQSSEQIVPSKLAVLDQMYAYYAD